MRSIVQATPFLHVPELRKALDLFTRVLRFKITYRLSDYAYVEREGAAIRLMEEPGRELPSGGEKLRIVAYIDVQDVDALYVELLGELQSLPKGDVDPPIDKAWGQREFHVRLPDGHWLAFGQPLGGHAFSHRHDA